MWSGVDQRWWLLTQPIIALVDRILDNSRDGDYPDIPADLTEIVELERQINRMVYELYRLTEEEVEVVEGAFKK